MPAFIAAESLIRSLCHKDGIAVITHNGDHPFFLETTPSCKFRPPYGKKRPPGVAAFQN